MSDKLVYDAFLQIGSQATLNSKPVSMNGNNAAMFEVWLKGASGLATPGVRATLEASNDGNNWTPLVFAGFSQTLVGTTGTTAPNYRAISTSLTNAIPFRQLRLSFAFGSPSVGGQSALIDADIRTYRRT